jgi:hypothetical protein
MLSILSCHLSACFYPPSLCTLFNYTRSGRSSQMGLYFDTLSLKLDYVTETATIKNFPCNKGLLDFEYGIVPSQGSTAHLEPPTFEILDGEVLRVSGSYTTLRQVQMKATKYLVTDPGQTNYCLHGRSHWIKCHWVGAFIYFFLLFTLLSHIYLLYCCLHVISFRIYSMTLVVVIKTLVAGG